MSAGVGVALGAAIEAGGLTIASLAAATGIPTASLMRSLAPGSPDRARSLTLADLLEIGHAVAGNDAVTVDDEHGTRAVAAVTRMLVEGDAFVMVDVEEPLSPEAALRLALVILGALA